MNQPAVTVGLVVGERVAEIVVVPDAVLWRMARRAQARALGAGVRGACRVEIRLLPRRGLPGLAAGVEVRVAGEGGVFLAELPAAALEPLLLSPAANLRAAAELPDDVAITYLVLRQRENPDAPVWRKALPAFLAAPARIAPGRTLFSDRAWMEDVPILIDEGVLHQCADLCRDDAVERGGALLGRVCTGENGTGGRLWVRVVAFAPAVGAEADATHLTFNAEAWRSIQRTRAAVEAGLGQTLQVVGWAHGHPRFSETGDSALFLSPQDVATTAQHFAEPFVCALVLDAEAEPSTSLEERLIVYGWDHYGISLAPRGLDLIDGRAASELKENRT
jgi:hypothetical protein